MASKTLTFLKNSNRDFNNVLDSMVNLQDQIDGTTTLPMGLNVVKGGITTLATDATTTVSAAITQPANTILMGVGILCTTAFTIGSGANMGINVGTAANGSNSSIVALDADSIYSSATAGLALNAVVTSFGGGPSGESGITSDGTAGVGFSLAFLIKLIIPLSPPLSKPIRPPVAFISLPNISVCINSNSDFFISPFLYICGAYNS